MNTQTTHHDYLAVDDDSPRHEFDQSRLATDHEISIKSASMATDRALNFQRKEMNQARQWLERTDLSPATRSAWEAIAKHHAKAVQWLAALADVMSRREFAGDGFVHYATDSKYQEKGIRKLIKLSKGLEAES